MSRSRAAVGAFACLTLLLCASWIYLTSHAPDGLEQAAAKLGFAGRAAALARAPLAGYRLTRFGSPAAGRIAAALIGAALCFVAAWLLGKLFARKPGGRAQATSDSRRGG